MPRGGARPGAGQKKGAKWPSTLAKEAVRELTRQKITAALEPMLNAQIAAVIGTSHLMLRNEDGTWRKAPESMTADEMLDVLNGDPGGYWIATKDSNSHAFNILAAYALDRPKEQAQDINMNVTDVGARLEAAREVARKRNAERKA